MLPSKIKAGTVAQEMVLTLDLAPTLLALAGVTPPAAMEGRSLTPIFSGDARNWRQSFFIEYYTDTVFPRVLNMGYTAIRTTRHKYIQYRELQNMDELYDLEADPFEMDNIIDTERGRVLVPELAKELTRLQRTGS